ncbi:MAG: VanZ family protein [Candidatus Kariarchaeaceae archaeon]|jgi:glycopeptide antibiotics resistance protein
MLLTNRLLVVVVYITVLITLVLGLWPLNLWPRNEVYWLKNQSGIELHKKGIRGKFVQVGIVYSNQPIIIPTNSKDDTNFFSIELYLESTMEAKFGTGRIVSFSEHEKQESLVLTQWRNHLIIRTAETQLINNRDYIEVAMLKALPKDSTRFITITSGTKGTNIYLNGEIKKHFPNVFLVSDNKSIKGKIIVGNSASGREPWAGKIFGLGIYEDELSPEIIKQDYQSWLSNNMTALTSKNNAIAIYTFDEGLGDIARNSVDQDIQLIIPDRFLHLEKTILEPPWINFNFDKSFVFDFTINLLGFIPLGVMFTLYFRKKFGFYGNKLILSTMLFGGLVSLTIELLQVQIPQRHSSLLDLVLNILGLSIGIFIIHFFVFMKRKVSAY